MGLGEQNTTCGERIGGQECTSEMHTVSIPQHHGNTLLCGTTPPYLIYHSTSISSSLDHFLKTRKIESWNKLSRISDECPEAENAQPKFRTTQPSLGLFLRFVERGSDAS